jgi:hypothetical protein
VMAITECRIWMPPVNLFTGAASASVAAHQRWSLDWMEKIMSKTKDTNKTRELTEAELAAVSGGYTLENTMISGYSVVATGTGGGTGTGSAGWDLRKNHAC